MYMAVSELAKRAGVNAEIAGLNTRSGFLHPSEIKAMATAAVLATMTMRT